MKSLYMYSILATLFLSVLTFVSHKPSTSTYGVGCPSGYNFRIDSFEMLSGLSIVMFIVVMYIYFFAKVNGCCEYFNKYFVPMSLFQIMFLFGSSYCLGHIKCMSLRNLQLLWLFTRNVFCFSVVMEYAKIIKSIYC